MPAVVIAFCGLLGLVIGSFLTVVSYRVPRRQSIVTPGSRCPNCGTPLAWYDNVPVISWLALRGRCRSCRTAISARYPALELATAAAFVALASVTDRPGRLVVYLTVASVALALVVAGLEATAWSGRDRS